jgi:hypothetical protein
MNASLVEFLKQVEALSPGDKIDLAMALLEQARASIPPVPVRAKWADVRGSLAYPSFGEDAQASINRMRDEWDERESTWRSRRED